MFSLSSCVLFNLAMFSLNNKINPKLFKVIVFSHLKINLVFVHLKLA